MNDTPGSFSNLGLPENLIKAIDNLGYETPSPIQEKAIPVLLEGGDILGQAQTGTGKTAAFALPMLARIDPKNTKTQALILAPTRELAIQVAEACQSYAKFIPQFNVLPIYGGQSYTNQLRQLKRGAQVVVGTPGRVMDHMRRGTLKLNTLSTLVLDEADEMLRMGFIDDVTWILEQTPSDRQIALFSATMPKEIKKVADTHLNDPTVIKIKSQTSTAQTIQQRYWLCKGLHKLDALTRILEVEDFDGIIIFVRTKVATEELAVKLNARGFSSAPLNGDIAQAAREKTIERLKAGKIDILVATDVVARGLDVERISHVINYDIPYDTEAYVHRIGRTGRAGRSGQAILFVAPRETRMLKAIEKASGQRIESMTLPTASHINTLRIEQFKQSIIDCVSSADLSQYKEMLETLITEQQLDPIDIGAALALLNQGDKPLLLDPRSDAKINRPGPSIDREERQSSRNKSKIASGPIKPLKEHPEVPLIRYQMDVGYQHNVKPGQIVAAIANATDLSSDYIGQIEIYEESSTVDLPEGMPKAILKVLDKTRVASKAMKLRPVGTKAVEPASKSKRRSPGDAERKRGNGPKPRKRKAAKP
ncbi:MAG: ATP-dependent RNA helicase [Oleiphilus sp.]|nr:MAG: ATP-dependent RNA helicase [Oleiphilus sp.]